MARQMQLKRPRTKRTRIISVHTHTHTYIGTHTHISEAFVRIYRQKHTVYMSACTECLMSINHVYTGNFIRRCRNYITQSNKYSCNLSKYLYKLEDFYYFSFQERINMQTQAYLSYRVFIISKIECAHCYFSLFLSIIFLLFRILPTSSTYKNIL